MRYPLSELIDRFSILSLKVIRLPENKEILKEHRAFLKAIAKYGFPDSVKYCKLLQKVNGDIWDLESAIRSGKEKALGLKEVGRRAIAIRELNKKRIKIKNEIAGRLKEFKEIKIDHASQD